VLAFAFLRFGPRVIPYPYDFVLCFGIISITCFLYLTVYQRWIAYSFHVLTLASIFALTGLEMTHRLFLCPTEAFRKITGVMGMIQAASFLFWSSVGPQLLNIWIKLPFLMVMAIAAAVCVASFAIYLYRSRNLAYALDDDQEEMEYLLKERAHYAKIRKSSSRRAAVQLDEGVMPTDNQRASCILRDEFTTRRGTMFLMNPTSSHMLEQFANQTLDAALPPHAKAAPEEHEDIVFGKKERRGSMEASWDIRKSIMQMASMRRRDGRRGARMSMARASRLRACAPVSALRPSCNEKMMEMETKRRMKSITMGKRASILTMM